MERRLQFCIPLSSRKRGLPHAHILVWLDHQQQRTDEIIGEAWGIVLAELPDVLEDPLAYVLVDEFMVHGPCGRMNRKCPCKKDGVCSKRFPKSFCEETHVDQSGYPIYRRRVDGRTVAKDGHVLDNRWVVPHNVALLKRYQAHMNVEWCNKTNLVKYLFKYITKGPDRANVAVCPVGGSSTRQQPEKGWMKWLSIKVVGICRRVNLSGSFIVRLQENGGAAAALFLSSGGGGLGRDVFTQLHDTWGCWKFNHDNSSSDNEGGGMIRRHRGA